MNDRQAGMAKASSQLQQPHVSLSRTVAIRFADQQPLLAELREALQQTHRSLSCRTCPVTLQLMPDWASAPVISASRHTGRY